MKAKLHHKKSLEQKNSMKLQLNVVSSQLYSIMPRLLIVLKRQFWTKKLLQRSVELCRFLSSLKCQSRPNCNKWQEMKHLSGKVKRLVTLSQLRKRVVSDIGLMRWPKKVLKTASVTLSNKITPLQMQTQQHNEASVRSGEVSLKSF